jgi:hypothetical protein
MKTRSANTEISPTRRSNSVSRAIRRKRSESVVSEASSSIPEDAPQTRSNRHVRSLRPSRACSQRSTERMSLQPSPGPLQADAGCSPLPIDSAIALSENGTRNKKVRFSNARLPNPGIIDSHNASSPIINAVSKKTKPCRPLTARLRRPTSSYTEEVQFTPLAEALDNRTERRMWRDRLSEEINSIGQSKRADVRKDQQLEILRQEIAEKDKVCKDFEMKLEQRHDMEIIELADIGLTQQDVVPDSALGVVTYQPLPSPVTVVLDPVFERQVRNFEEVVKTLTNQVVDAKAALQIVEIELRSLGFTEGDCSSGEILRAIRTAFRQSRLELGELLPCPDDVLNGLNDQTNGVFLTYLLQQIRRLVAELTERETFGREEEELALLRGQHKGLLGKLSETQDINARLNNIINLQEDEITKLDAYILEIMNKIDEQIVAYEKLGLGFERAARELEEATNLAENLQEEHDAALEKLCQETADAKEAFETETSNERLAKEKAQNDVDAKQTMIFDLEQGAEEMRHLVAGLREQLVDARNYGAAENTQREAILTLLNDKDETISSLEASLLRAGNQANMLRLNILAEQAMLEQVAINFVERDDRYQADKLKAAEDYSTLQTTSQKEINDLQGKIDHLQWSVSNYESRCAQI